MGANIVCARVRHTSVSETAAAEQRTDGGVGFQSSTSACGVRTLWGTRLFSACRFGPLYLLPVGVADLFTHSKSRVGSGRTRESPDSYSANWAHGESLELQPRKMDPDSRALITGMQKGSAENLISNQFQIVASSDCPDSARALLGPAA